MMNNKVGKVDDSICSIALYLYGNSISADDASRLLNLTPTRSRNRGDVRVTSSGSEVVQKIGFWEYRIRVMVSQIVPSLVEMFSEIKCTKIVGECGIEKAELDIFIPLDIEIDQSGFSIELPSNLLNKLSGLGFNVIVTSR